MSDASTAASGGEQQQSSKGGGSSKKKAATRVRYAGELYHPGDEIEFKSDKFSTQQNKEIRERLEKLGAIE